jgi:hypothetical protein
MQQLLQFQWPSFIPSNRAYWAAAAHNGCTSACRQSSQAAVGHVGRGLRAEHMHRVNECEGVEATGVRSPGCAALHCSVQNGGVCQSNASHARASAKKLSKSS